ncbi:unnamed protein product [Blepharisma stoltei]|uniref:Transposase n=1 Tax=Blepharisma stoltei TaxID=1481888 RepID=A0AAU9IU35_9CILI|nr:unnamed protein product [Blepharisma stoltei]
MDYRLLLRKWNDGESIVKRIIDVGFFKNEELATILGTSKRTIERIAAENTESESDEAAGREEALSRSPLKHWSDEDFAEVIKECEKDTGFVSKASLRAQFKRKTVDISEEQLGKELKKRGYVYRKKRTVLQLTEAHKEQRMSWARSLIDSDIASWIFSDECYVHLFRNSNLCKEGINATIEEPINWKTSIMIWGGISIVFGKMLFIKKEKYAINAQVYIRDILQGYIEPMETTPSFRMGQQPILQCRLWNIAEKAGLMWRLNRRRAQISIQLRWSGPIWRGKWRKEGLTAKPD